MASRPAAISRKSAKDGRKGKKRENALRSCAQTEERLESAGETGTSGKVL